MSFSETPTRSAEAGQHAGIVGGPARSICSSSAAGYAAEQLNKRRTVEQTALLHDALEQVDSKEPAIGSILIRLPIQPRRFSDAAASAAGWVSSANFDVGHALKLGRSRSRRGTKRTRRSVECRDIGSVAGRLLSVR